VSEQAGLVSCQDVPDASKLVLLNGFVDDVLGQGLLFGRCLTLGIALVPAFVFVEDAQHPSPV
jgi:hypothetical protein